eukprot:2263734-Amphidinium_carterae.2
MSKSTCSTNTVPSSKNRINGNSMLTGVGILEQQYHTHGSNASTKSKLEAGSPCKRPDQRTNPPQFFRFQEIHAVIGARIDSKTCSRSSGIPDARNTAQSQYRQRVGYAVRMSQNKAHAHGLDDIVKAAFAKKQNASAIDLPF